MSIFKLQSGLIFDDHFQDIDPRWIISPSDSLSLDSSKLVFEHSESDNGTMALFELPSEDSLVFQVEAEYVPTTLGDEGGIIIWNSGLNKLEFLESVESGRTDEYSIWQARKRGNLWSFFAQRSGQWEMFDSSILIDPPMAGIILKGNPNVDYQSLNATRSILCKGYSLTVGNVNSGYRIELLDSVDTIVRTQIIPDTFAGVDIDLPTLPFSGRIRIYDGDRLVSEQKETTDFYGGDVYLHGTDLQIVWNDQELNINGITFLGTMQNNLIQTKMTAKNPTTGDIANDINLAIKQYTDEFGWEWVDVANDSSGSPGEWLDTIQLGNLGPNESIDFWVRVVKNDSNWATKPTHFIFDLNHQ